jgi:dTDP-4-amino-4,6-dideoxygalactose transaminase
LLSASGADLQPIARRYDDSCLMYVVRVAAEIRDAVRAAMAAAGVATSVHYPSLARHPLFGNVQPEACCDNQDEAIITLPTFAELTADDQRRVVEALVAALDGAHRTAPVADVGPHAMTLE